MKLFLIPLGIQLFLFVCWLALGYFWIFREIK